MRTVTGGREGGIPLPPLDKPNRSRCASAGRNSPSVGPPPPIHRYHLPNFHLHPPFPSSILRSGGACYLNEGLPTVVGVECDRVPPPRASPAARGKCGERVPSLSPRSFPSISCQSCSLVLLPSLFLSYCLSLSSFSFALLFSPLTLHLPHPLYLTLPPPVQA